MSGNHEPRVGWSGESVTSTTANLDRPWWPLSEFKSGPTPRNPESRRVDHEKLNKGDADLQAVHRNRIKRQLREAFRLNKANYASELKNYYLIALIYMSREQQPFAQTQDKLKEAFLRLLSTDTSTNSA